MAVSAGNVIGSAFVEIKPEISAFESALQQGLTGPMQRQGSLMSKVFVGAAVGLGAIATGAIAAVNHTIDLGQAAYEMGEKFGLSGQQASTFVAIGKLVGVSSDQMGIGMRTLSKQLNTTALDLKNHASAASLNKLPLQELGIASTDASGNLRDMNSVLGDVADRFQAMPDGPQKAALATQLFGRAGTDLIPILDKGSKGLADLTAQAQAEGAIMSGPQVEAAHKAYLAHQKLNEALSGVALTLGSALMPYLAEAANWLSKHLPEAINTLHVWIDKHRQDIGHWAGVIKDVLVEAFNKLRDVVGVVLNNFLIPLGKFVADHKQAFLDLGVALAAFYGARKVGGFIGGLIDDLKSVVGLAGKIPGLGGSGGGPGTGMRVYGGPVEVTGLGAPGKPPSAPPGGTNVVPAASGGLLGFLGSLGGGSALVGGGVVALASGPDVVGFLQLNTMQDLMKNNKQAVSNANAGFNKAVGDFFSGAYQTLSDHVGGFFGAVGGFFHDLPGHLSGVWQTLSDHVGGFFDAVGGFFHDLPGNIAGFFTSIPGAVGGFFAKIGDFLTHIDFHAAGVAVHDAIGWFFGQVGGFFHQIPGRVADGFKAVLGAVGSFLGAVGGFFHDLPGRIAGALGTVFGAIGSFLTGKGGMGAFFHDLPGRLGGFFANVWGGITGFLGAVGGFFHDLPGRIGGFFANIWGGFTGFMGAVAGGFTGFIGGVGNWIGGIWGAVTGFFGAIISGIGGLIQHVYQALSDVVGGFFGGLFGGGNKPSKPGSQHGDIIDEPGWIFTARKGLRPIGEGGLIEAVVPLQNTWGPELTSGLARFAGNAAPSLSSATSTGAVSGGVQIVQHFHINGGDPREVQSIIHREFNELQLALRTR